MTRAERQQLRSRDCSTLQVFPLDKHKHRFKQLIHSESVAREVVLNDSAHLTSAFHSFLDRSPRLRKYAGSVPFTPFAAALPAAGPALPPEPAVGEVSEAALDALLSAFTSTLSAALSLLLSAAAVAESSAPLAFVGESLPASEFTSLSSDFLHRTQ